MRPSTIAELKSIAREIKSGTITPPYSLSEQRAIQIFNILQDGEWHKTGEITKTLGEEVSSKHVGDILRACASGWGLISNTRRGYRLAKEGQEAADPGKLKLIPDTKTFTTISISLERDEMLRVAGQLLDLAQRENISKVLLGKTETHQGIFEITIKRKWRTRKDKTSEVQSLMDKE